MLPLSANSKLTDDEERAKDDRNGTLGWPRSSSFGPASSLLGDLFIAEVLVHGKPAEVSAAALDALFGIELEAVAVEEWSGDKTGVGGNSRGANRAQCELDALVKAAGNTATHERGMSEEEVEVAIVRVGSEACDNPVRLGNDSVKPRQALLPA